ncbi:MAG: class I SAM-dependent methyltransferase [Negativicutes bacterium]|jgi:SAM-dependent methyltransferase
MTKTPKNWYRDFFVGAANKYWDSAISVERTLAECNFLTSILPAGAELLDIPSGCGRLAKVLLERGFAVTAVDVSEENIAKLKHTVSSPKLTALVADMTEYVAFEKFAGACCFGNSFNYFDFRLMKKFVGNVSKSLQKHSPFIVHSGVIAESLLLNIEERTWHNVAGLNVLLEHSYNPLQSMLITDYTFINDDGARHTKQIYHYVYTLAETKRIFADSGLKLRDVYSDTAGSDYVVGCPDCYLVAEKM